ncbi:hypothetical protein [Staphylococcus phage vB_SauM-V1SA22]|nr:hypothetical protein [Staphylococcus phage vB_SauM-V1SA22]
MYVCLIILLLKYNIYLFGCQEKFITFYSFFILG